MTAVMPRRLRAIAATVVLSAIGTVTAHTTEAAAPATYASAFNPSAYQRNVQYYVNAHRRANGAAPVALHWALNSAAQSHATDMARNNRMSHTGSNGSNGGSRIRAAGFNWSMWGENVAVGYGSSSAVVYAWMHSAGHRANILNRGFRYMGLGVVFARGTVWWCLVLAS